MYKGETIAGRKFFDLLFENEGFNSELGKVALAAGKLETELILYYTRQGVKGNFTRLPLGELIKKGKANNLLDSNLVEALVMICKQRNYLTHNIYALLIESKEETILEGRDLLDSDVFTYKERAWQLKENLISLSKVIQKK